MCVRVCVFSAAIYIHLYLIRLLRFSGLLFLFINSNSSSQMYTFTEGGICDRERYCTKANENKWNKKKQMKYNRSKCVRIILYVSSSIFYCRYFSRCLFDINQMACSLVDSSKIVVAFLFGFLFFHFIFSRGG